MARPKKTETSSEPAGVINATASETAPAQEAPKEDSVKVSKSLLEQVLENQKRLEAQLKERDEKIEMLTHVADKSRLNKWEMDHQGELIRVARVGLWRGVPVIGWQSESDIVEYVGDRMVVNQKINVFTQIDGEAPVSETVDYRNWALQMKTEEGEIIGKSSNTSGEFYTLKLKNGRELTLDVRFLNAF